MKRIGKYRAWNKGKETSQDVKQKLSVAHMGKKHSKETRKKISNSNKGQIPWNKGMPLPKETRMRMSKSHTGEKNPNWQGGISFNPYPTEWVDLLKESIRQRDNYVCQMCGTHQDELKSWSKKLDVHHIDYDKDNCDPKNLITLCRNCHIKTNGNREYWKKCFNKEGGEKIK